MAFSQGINAQTPEYATFNGALKSHAFSNVFTDGQKQRPELKRHITQESLSKSLAPPPPCQSVLPVSSACKPKRPPRSSPSKILLAPCESKSLASSCLRSSLLLRRPRQDLRYEKTERGRLSPTKRLSTSSIQTIQLPLKET